MKRGKKELDLIKAKAQFAKVEGNYKGLKKNMQDGANLVRDRTEGMYAVGRKIDGMINPVHTIK